MEYGQRDELKSEPKGERTTMMMRSVREILKSQGQEHLLDAENFEASSEAVTMPPRSMPRPAATSSNHGVQRPPHMQAELSPALGGTAPAPAPEAEATPETAPADKSRSLLSRLVGR